MSTYVNINNKTFLFLSSRSSDSQVYEQTLMPDASPNINLNVPNNILLWLEQITNKTTQNIPKYSVYFSTYT